MDKTKMPKPFMKRKWVRVCLTFMGITVLAYVVGYFGSAHSDAFAETKRYLQQSPEIRTELGEVKAITLTPFGYELEFAGSSGSATFDCNIQGAKGEGEAIVKLEKSFSWHVVSVVVSSQGKETRLL